MLSKINLSLEYITGTIFSGHRRRIITTTMGLFWR